MLPKGIKIGFWSELTDKIKNSDLYDQLELLAPEKLTLALKITSTSCTRMMKGALFIIQSTKNMPTPNNRHGNKRKTP